MRVGSDVTADTIYYQSSSLSLFDKKKLRQQNEVVVGESVNRIQVVCHFQESVSTTFLVLVGRRRRRRAALWARNQNFVQKPSEQN